MTCPTAGRTFYFSYSATLGAVGHPGALTVHTVDMAGGAIGAVTVVQKCPCQAVEFQAEAIDHKAFVLAAFESRDSEIDDIGIDKGFFRCFAYLAMQIRMRCANFPLFFSWQGLLCHSRLDDKERLRVVINRIAEKGMQGDCVRINTIPARGIAHALQTHMQDFWIHRLEARCNDPVFIPVIEGGLSQILGCLGLLQMLTQKIIRALVRQFCCVGIEMFAVDTREGMIDARVCIYGDIRI